jgi:hypothetical protein
MEIILESQFRGGHYITSRISPELERLPHSKMIETLLKYFNQKAQCRSMASKPTYGKNRFQTSMEQCFYHYQLNRAANFHSKFLSALHRIKKKKKNSVVSTLQFLSPLLPLSSNFEKVNLQRCPYSIVRRRLTKK